MELAAKVVHQNFKRHEIEAIIYGMDGSELATAAELAQKFTENPFMFQVNDEQYYYLEQILTAKKAAFGKMTTLYEYVKRKLMAFDGLSTQEIGKYHLELVAKFRGVRGELLTEIMQTKGDDEYCHFYDFITGFHLTQSRATLRQKFSFIYEKLKDEKGGNLHKPIMLNSLIQN